MIGIYKITNNITNKVYIGQSGRIENRFNNHIKSSQIESGKQYYDEMYCDMRKYGVENFKFEILETVSLNELEEKWIQEAVKNGEDLYNKVLTPFSNSHSYARRFSDEDIDKIYNLLKENKLSNIKIAKEMNCSSSAIDDINNGKTYARENENYPIRDCRKTGERHYNSRYTDEEVMNIRKEYKNMTIKELYKKYGSRCSEDNFEKIVIGRSYSHLPIYRKKEEKWINK